MLKRLFIISLFIVIILGYRWYARSEVLLNDLSFSQTVYDEEGVLLRITLSKDEKYRVFRSLDEISPLLTQATLLQEDQYFFFHPGINPISLSKAAWQTYVVRSRAIGASTITMQLARMLYGMHTKNSGGKLKQILKALQLELLYSKREILEAYLNLASYGGNIEGIGAASLIYFGKSSDCLSLHEALILSVIPQNPRRRTPGSANHDSLEFARKKLFDRWVELHLKDEQEPKLIDLPIQFTKKNLPFRAPHFVDSVLRENPQLKIFTTLNSDLKPVFSR